MFESNMVLPFGSLLDALLLLGAVFIISVGVAVMGDMDKWTS